MRTRFIYALSFALILWLTSAALARADDSTPVPTTAPVVVATEQPTIPVAVDTPLPVVTSAPPQIDSTPVTVVREKSTPIASVAQTPESGPTSGPETLPTVGESTPPPGVSVPLPVSSATPSSPISSGSSAPIPVDTTTTPPSEPISSAPTLDLTVPSTSSQAPAELTCSGTKHPAAGPFMVAPFHGWTEVVSFLDHDQPDYAVDGKIVLANGLTALATDGQESDVFPAYWSPALRQFINYDGHNGYDFAISYQPVYAAAAGTIQFAGWSNSGYGNMILINHHNGYVTLYGHLSQLDVQTGDRVSTGQEIAISGSTGRSTGPHLHFSVFLDCNVVDPYGWTGSGRDPLQAFGGEQSSYLWLPGHDPLLVNPPPDWPAFPQGLSVKIPPADVGLAAQAGVLPPTDRLLLLGLPAPSQAGPVSPGVALAQTEARITEEAESLGPQLDDLRAQGLVESYQLLPAAGAIWVHGRATTEELEGLNGVASLAGTEPRDLIAAEQGLAHALLIEMGHQSAPTLWPAGFRSGLHTWRPISTILMNSPMLAGFGLPGDHVAVTLHRGGTVVATATTSTEPDSGGFVATLQDALGTPVPVRPGDVVEVESGGRTSRIQARALSVQARRSLVFGSVAPFSTVSLSILPPGQSPQQRLLGAGWSGRFLDATSPPLVGGSQIVAGTSDYAGNNEAASAFVPGFIAVEGTSQVSGWTVSQAPRLSVVRHGRVLVSQAINPASDGTFEVELQNHGVATILAPGDVLTLGSRRHHRSVVLPNLSAPLTDSARLHIQGPAHATVQLTFRPAGRQNWTSREALDSSGAANVHLPGGPAVPGDSSSVQFVLPSGDTVETVNEARGILVHQGSAHVDGKVRPGALVSLHAFNAAGRLIGSAVASTGLSGEFHAVLHDARGHRLRLSTTRTLLVHEDRATVRFEVPKIAVRVDHAHAALIVNGPADTLLFVSRWYAHGARNTIRIRTNAAGAAELPLTPSPLLRATARWVGSNGLTIERVDALHSTASSLPAVAPGNRCATSSRTGKLPSTSVPDCAATRHMIGPARQ